MDPLARTMELAEQMDEKYGARVAFDFGSGFLHWAFDDNSSALVTVEGRTAVVVYEDGDYEVADWYEERITL